MPLLLLLLIIGLLAFAVYFAAGRSYRLIVLPTLLMLGSLATVLFARYIFYSLFLWLLLFIPCAVLLASGAIVALVKWLGKKKPIGNRKGIVLLALAALTLTLFFTPPMTTSGRYRIYKGAYQTAAQEFWGSTDTQEIYELQYYKRLDRDTELLEAALSNEGLSAVSKLKLWAGISRIFVDENAVYFQLGASLHTVEGIVVLKGGGAEPPNGEFIRRFIQSPHFTYMEDGIFLYNGGL